MVPDSLWPPNRFPDASRVPVQGYVHRLEQVIIEWLDTMHVQASRKTGLPGCG